MHEDFHMFMAGFLSVFLSSGSICYLDMLLHFPFSPLFLSVAFSSCLSSAVAYYLL